LAVFYSPGTFSLLARSFIRRRSVCVESATGTFSLIIQKSPALLLASCTSSDFGQTNLSRGLEAWTSMPLLPGFFPGGQRHSTVIS
jgi:hypothetical protein